MGQGPDVDPIPDHVHRDVALVAAVGVAGVEEAQLVRRVRGGRDGLRDRPVRAARVRAVEVEHLVSVRRFPRGVRDDIDLAGIDRPLRDVRRARDVLHPVGGDVRALEAAVVDEVAGRRRRQPGRWRRIRGYGCGADRGRLRREQAGGDDRDDRPDGQGAPPAASWTGSMQPMVRRQPEFHVSHLLTRALRSATNGPAPQTGKVTEEPFVVQSVNGLWC